MDYRQAIKRAESILRAQKIENPPADFLKYAELVAYAAGQLSKRQRGKRPWLMEWAEEWRFIYDNFEKIVKADPMCRYMPKNPMSEGFHASNAFVRYACTANRCSKTQSGYAEHYFCATGDHPFRPDLPQYPASSLVVAGLPFTDYAPRVFEKKMLTGEDENILSPMFPVGGKWFYHYDPRKYILTIACPECANAGKAGSCPGHHKKATIALVSSEKGVGVIEAFSVRLFHIDEHVPGEFFHAGKMRVADQPGGSIAVTGTPLHGLEAWETRELRVVAEGDKKQNKMPDGRPYVSLHETDMYGGNIVPHDVIDGLKKGMDEFEIEARIYGKPAPLAKNPVFDRTTLASLREIAVDPLRGNLVPTADLIDVTDGSELKFLEEEEGDLRVWEEPKPGCQYIIGVDSAAGLTGRDASCATVLKMQAKGGKLHLDQVAQYHGWINPLSYGDEVFKLGVWYNSAMAVIELTGGLGRAVALRLSRELSYWNIFRDTSKPEFAQFGQDARFGIDTNAATKPFMVGATQSLLKEGRLNIRCVPTIGEMVAFEQERTESGLNVRYRGAGGAHDDRVMSIVIATSVAVSSPIFDFSQDTAEAAAEKPQYQGEWAKIHKEMSDAANPDAF